MLLVIVSNGANVIGKEVYDGDDIQNAELIAGKQAENPSLAYTIVTDQKSFDQTELDVTPSQEETDWQKAKAKGVADALSYLAKTLNLE